MNVRLYRTLCVPVGTWVRHSRRHERKISPSRAHTTENYVSVWRTTPLGSLWLNGKETTAHKGGLEPSTLPAPLIIFLFRPRPRYLGREKKKKRKKDSGLGLCCFGLSIVLVSDCSGWPKYGCHICTKKSSVLMSENNINHSMEVFIYKPSQDATKYYIIERVALRNIIYLL